MPVTFDALRSSDAGAFDARGSVTVSCSGSNGAAIAACVDMIPPSANAAGQILLSGPAKGGALPFQVFQDAGLRLPWGSAGAGRGAVLTRTGDGVMTAPVYARLYVQAKAAAAGTYAAHIPVTLRYGAAEAGPVNCASLGAGSTPGGRGGRANAPAGAVRGPAPALGGAVMTPAPGSRR